MDRKQAYKILGVAEGSSKEEIKKAFKSSAARLHPDNKSTGDEAAFKELNSAYQLIESGKETDEFVPPSSPWANVDFQGVVDIGSLFGDIFNIGNPFSSKSQSQVKDITLTITISFRDAILGCQVPIKYPRLLKCLICNGQGKTIIDACSKCHGSGRLDSKKGNTIYTSRCDQCKGKVQTQPCAACKRSGSFQSEVEGQINIEAGTSDNALLRLKGHGNFAGLSVFGEAFSDVLITVRVNPINGLSMQGRDVVSHLTISLLEALEGCNKQVITIDGEKSLVIPKHIRHQEEIKMANLGVARQGYQRVILNVEYPSNTDKLIKVLKDKDNAISD